MMYSGVLRMLLLVLLIITVAAFIETPTSQNVSIGQEAPFRCQHSMADIIRWRIDGSLVSRSSLPDGVRIDTDGLVDVLIIAGRLDYNGTEVVCVARFDDDSPEQVSDPALLIVTVDENTTVDTTMEFVTSPLSVNVTVSCEIVFHCEHLNSDGLSWLVNGTALRSQTHLHNTFRESTSGRVHNLTVTALSQYNSTWIECVAFFLNDQPSERTPPALLLIQGPLDPVRSLTRVNNVISWVPPFSLDLTDVDPDIIYCVDVYNITCEERDLVITDCNVIDTSYTYTSLSDGYLYECIVTPRSNVEGAENGTANHINALPEFAMFSSGLSLARPGSLIYQIELNYTPVVPIPSAYSLSLEALDGLDSSDHVEANATEKQPMLILDVAGLEFRRLWNCIIRTYVCKQNEILTDETLSTHDFRDIYISAPLDNVVGVTGTFIEGSTATGVLVIVSSANESYYRNVPRDGNGLKETNITHIGGGEYTVSVFVVEENELPFKRAAIIPEHLSVKGVVDTAEPSSPTFEYSVESTSTGFCVQCNFLDNNASECIAVVHDRGLMNIKSSHKFTRSGDTASDCKNVNLEDYQVGVIGGRQVQRASSSPVCGGCISGSVLAVIFFGASPPVVIAIVCTSRKYCRKKSGRRLIIRSSGDANGESGLPDRSDPNHYEKCVEITPLVPRFTRVRTDSSGSGVVQLQPSSLDTQLEEASFTSPPVPPHRASDDGLIGAVPESAYAEPSRLVHVKPSVSIPPATEHSTYSNVDKFKNQQGLNYALLEHVSQRQHNPQPDDRYTATSEYATVQTKKEDCSKIKEGEGNVKMFAPKPVRRPPPPPPPCTPCDLESVGSLFHPISYKWEKFAKALSLDEDYVDDVIEDVIAANENDEARLQDMLKRYFDNGDFKHNWEEVVSILRGVDEQLADRIHDLHVYPHKTSLPGQVQDVEDSNTTVNSQSDWHIECENEGAKIEMMDASHIKDAASTNDDTASSSDDEGFNDTEQEQPAEENCTTTPVQESVSVGIEPDHPNNEDGGSLVVGTVIVEAQKLVLNQTDSKGSDLKIKHFHSLRKLDTDDGDSEMASDTTHMNTKSAEQLSYMYSCDDIDLAAELVFHGRASMQPSGQGYSHKFQHVYATGHTHTSRDDGDDDDGYHSKKQSPNSPYRDELLMYVGVTGNLANCLWNFPDPSSCVPCTVEQEMSSLLDVDISKHNYIRQLRRAQESKLLMQEEYQKITRQTCDEVCRDTEVSVLKCESETETSVRETENSRIKRLRVEEDQKKRRHQLRFQRKTVF